MNTITKKPNPKVPLAVTAVRQALPFIKKFYAKNGYMPSNRELSAACGRTSAQWGRLALRELEKQKLIKVGKKQFRKITII